MSTATLPPAATTVTSTPDGPPDMPRRVRQRRPPSDRLFRGAARAGGTVVLAVMLLVGVFLTSGAVPAISRAGWGFVTNEDWDTEGNNFGVVGVLTGTVLIALVAITVAVPLAVGVAL